MSNEQTVRDALDVRHLGALENVIALGLDPDMSVSELQRRLRIADRVLEALEGDGTLAWVLRAENWTARADLVGHVDAIGWACDAYP